MNNKKLFIPALVFASLLLGIASFSVAFSLCDEVAFSLKSNKSQYFEGKDISVTLSLTNTSTETLKIHMPEPLYEQTGFQMKSGEDSKWQDYFYNRVDGGGPYTPIGGLLPSRELKRVFDFSEISEIPFLPGEYAMKAYYYYKNERDTIFSNEVTFWVSQPTGEELEAFKFKENNIAVSGEDYTIKGCKVFLKKYPKSKYTSQVQWIFAKEYMRMAGLAWGNRDYDRGIKLYKEAIKEFNNFIKMNVPPHKVEIAKRLRAWSYFRMGDTQRGIDDMEKIGSDEAREEVEGMRRELKINKRFN